VCDLHLFWHVAIKLIINPCRRIYMVGIVSNLSAQNAQANLQKANLEAQSSISRLSSGMRIDRASTDVAGLAIGTILKTNVSTLGAALTNTSQASSLLGVIDGSLKGIGDILQRQKSLATQSTSGSLSDSARSFLNQEFQNLYKEIDRIASTTNFNGTKLLDGSLYAPSKLASQAKADSVATSGALTMVAAMADTDTIAINGVTFTFATAPLSDPRQVALGGAGAADATTLMTAIENVLATDDEARAGDKALLSGLSFSRSGATITITSKSAGTIYNAAGGSVINITGATGTAGDITVNGTDAGTATVALSAGAVAATNGDLFSGTFATSGATAYSGTATTIARGTVSDTILTAIAETAAASGAGNATGINTAGVSNNSAFVGKISGFKGTYNQAGVSDLSIKVGDYTYTASNVLNAPAADAIVRFASVEAGGGFFDLQINDATTSGETAVTNQADTDKFTNRLNRALEGIDFFQKRTISSYSGTGSIFPTGSTTQSGNLAGSTFKLINSNFGNLQIENVKVQAPVSGGTQGLIEVTINGEVFRSGYNAAGTTTALGTTISASAAIGLVSTTDPRKVIEFTNGSTAITFDTKDKADGFQKALERAFGVKEGGTSAGLSFQVGIASTDTISVQVQGSTSSDIYVDANGLQTSVDISTFAGASAAGTTLDTAINKVTSLRAAVGALQSRFDYASANIQSSIQNQDAARGIFLDTDIPSESTAFAQSTVRLNAAISVLSQANQLPQSLLKLIG
jgi:flagellin